MNDIDQLKACGMVKDKVGIKHDSVLANADQHQ
jgi:hypothetical protein